MNKLMLRLVFLLALLPGLPAQADTPSACKEADKALQSYLLALRNHQLSAVRNYIEPATTLKVEWLDSMPSKFFTLNRDDYLQSLKASWHFGREEKLAVGPVQWQASTAACEAGFTLIEKRLLFGNDSGQESQLQLRWENTASGWRVTYMKSRTRMW
ncbi:MAG: hypothetical protein ACRERR_06220 [Moraxellaceae bacterium]